VHATQVFEVVLQAGVAPLQAPLQGAAPPVAVPPLEVLPATGIAEKLVVPAMPALAVDPPTASSPPLPAQVRVESHWLLLSVQPSATSNSTETYTAH
jgi:hypothetical protein